MREENKGVERERKREGKGTVWQGRRENRKNKEIKKERLTKERRKVGKGREGMEWRGRNIGAIYEPWMLS